MEKIAIKTKRNFHLCVFSLLTRIVFIHLLNVDITQNIDPAAIQILHLVRGNFSTAYILHFLLMGNESVVAILHTILLVEQALVKAYVRTERNLKEI